MKKIVFLGRFDDRKGPAHMIRALGLLHKMGKLPDDLEVIMGGKGPDLEQCIELVKTLGLSDRIAFPGFVDEAKKADLLASADISVFPSTGGEAFGISVVEAMASGSAIVLGGNNAGYRSILGGMPELLFEPTDVDAFSSLLLHYLTASIQELVSVKSWLKIEAKKYDVQLVCERLLSEYRN